MKLYVGARDYKPEGYLTLDIDSKMNPDIVGDITNLGNIDSSSYDEIVVSHVLEHLEWPESYLALMELTRILRVGGTIKIAVPDMGSMIRMMLSGDSVWHVIGLIYGVGGRTNKFEQHRYGFTAGMLVDILEVLGYTKLDWWNHKINDASNGWIPSACNKNVGMSLNISGVKSTCPIVDGDLLYHKLIEQPLDDFMMIAADCSPGNSEINTKDTPSKLYQRINFKLIEANQRIKYLENKLIEVEAKALSSD